MPSRILEGSWGLPGWGSQDQPLPPLPGSLISAWPLVKEPASDPVSSFAPRQPQPKCHPSPFLLACLGSFPVVFNDRSIDKQPDLAAQILLSACPLLFCPEVFVLHREQRTEVPIGPCLYYLSVCGWLFTGVASERSSPRVLLLPSHLPLLPYRHVPCV